MHSLLIHSYSTVEASIFWNHLFRAQYYIYVSMLQIRRAQEEAQMAKTEAQMAFDRSEQAKNQSEQSRQDLEGLITRISDFLGQKGARPADIRAVGGLVLVFAY